jgi:outer membrane protein assembly factor BamB
VTKTCTALLLLFSVASIAAADLPHDLRLAARSGDLATVKRLVGDGVDVDAADAWGTTALLLAAKQEQTDVVRYLLDEGADPSVREQFFGASALDYSLWEGGPDYVVAKLLLAAGARDRATALATAIDEDNVGLALAAVASGPLPESEAAEIRRRYPDVEGRLGEILATVRTEPDPPPPVYGEAELASFTGRYEPREGEGLALVAVRDGRLVLTFEGEEVALEAFRERLFRNTDSGIVVRYRGRAGTIEGLSIERTGKPPLSMRVADTTQLATVDLPEPPETGETPVTVNWPAFRGHNRDGRGDGRDTPVTFDLASGEGVAWRAGLPGLGNSSPVVWGDRVFVTTAVAEGGSTPLRTGLTGSGEEIEEKTEHRWLALAFDKKTGDKLWETEIGRAVPLTKRHFKSTQANSSPATDGEHVVVVFPTAGLACLGMDGKIHWKHELGGLNAGGFNDPGLQWGFAASPIIYDGKVILQVDVHDGPYLAAWDLASGKPLWRTERPGIAPSWSTPAIWPTPGGDQLVVNASVIHGYDPDDGRLLWTLGPTSVQVVAAPVVGDPELFVSSGYPPVRPVYAVKPGIEGEHRIDFDAEKTDPALAWGLERGGAYMPTPLLYRGLLWIVHHNARVVAHDARSGKPVVRARLSAGGTCTASPVAANGKIYQGTEEGTLYVLEASPDFRELAVHEIGEPLMATPAISEGLLILRTPGELIALGNRDAGAADGGGRRDEQR